MIRCGWLSEESMRNENEKQILKAIHENDVESLEKIVKNPCDCRLGSLDIPILLVAVMIGNIDMIKYLIDKGCDTREVDKRGQTAWDMLFREYIGVAMSKNQSEIADILLGTYSNPVEVVFLTANKYKRSPFLEACGRGYDWLVLRFLNLLQNNSISMEHVIGYEGDNVFHYLLYWHDSWSPARLEIVRALMDKFPNFLQLIDATNDRGDTPLYGLFERGTGNSPDVIDLTKLFLQLGASPDVQGQNGVTLLDMAIWRSNVSLVEILLRAGCRTDIFYKRSPLFFLLKNKPANFICIIERLLAFGYDLQKELFLYTVDERPIEFSSPEYAKRCDTSGMDLGILKALQELRRSNKMLSLQRQCRNTIRRHLKAKADDVIGSLNCISDRIKSYLLVKNEPALLDISE